MKPNYTIFSVIIYLFFQTGVNAQGTGCEVTLTSIAGTYTGDCSKGKASGKGMSVGTDKYTGEFKAGLPEGKGVYEWKNGDIFDGLWVKGVREGRGIMTMKREGKTDSILVGIWQNNNYAGNYDNPYTIYQKGMYTARLDLRKNKNSKENAILINAMSASAGMGTLTGGRVAPAGTTTTTAIVGVPAGSSPPSSMSGTSAPSPAILTDILVSRGAYQQIVDGAASSRGTSKKLIQVSYPFRAIYRISGQDVEIEIFEPGDWTITVSLNK